MAWLIPTDSHQSVPPKAGAHKAHVRLDSPLPPGLWNSGTNFSLWQQEGHTSLLWVFPLSNTLHPF